jgi:hypothetical protein
MEGMQLVWPSPLKPSVDLQATAAVRNKPFWLEVASMHCAVEDAGDDALRSLLLRLGRFDA